jgi:glutathione S-transferase
MTLELYHADHSVCAQKVRIALAEKQLDWTSHLLDLMAGDTYRPEYVRINPKRVVPALVDDGTVIVESTVINEYLDDAFPDPPLRPAAPADRARMRLWTKQLDEGIHYSTGVISNGMVFHPLRLQTRSREEILAEIESHPDPSRRERQREALEKGLDSRFFKAAVKRLDTMLDDMEEALSSGPWLAGDSYSLADAGLAPYVTRLDNIHFLDATAEHPRVMDWFDRVRARPSYETAIRKWWNEGKVKLMNDNGAEAVPRLREVLQEA